MSDIVNVLVHGLFFMRMSLDGKKNLELIVPKVTGHGIIPHNFLGGVRKPKALKKLTGDEKWLNIGLIGGSPSPFKTGTTIPNDVSSSVLQFTIPENELGNWNPDYFGGSLTLPWPKGFFSVRCDYFDRAFLYKQGNIGNAIKNHCRSNDPNAKVGFITCLQYNYDPKVGIRWDEWAPTKNLHCYFEPCKVHKVTEVNQDLKQAAYCFVNYNNFHLEMETGADALKTERGEKCPTLPSGVNDDDDYSLAEDPFAKSQEICPADIPLDNINPSNCPNFFVGNNP